jgi:hypothetical protein
VLCNPTGFDRKKHDRGYQRERKNVTGKNNKMNFACDEMLRKTIITKRATCYLRQRQERKPRAFTLDLVFSRRFSIDVLRNDILHDYLGFSCRELNKLDQDLFRDVVGFVTAKSHDWFVENVVKAKRGLLGQVIGDGFVGNVFFNRNFDATSTMADVVYYDGSYDVPTSSGHGYVSKNCNLSIVDPAKNSKSEYISAHLRDVAARKLEESICATANSSFTVASLLAVLNSPDFKLNAVKWKARLEQLLAPPAPAPAPAANTHEMASAAASAAANAVVASMPAEGSAVAVAVALVVPIAAAPAPAPAAVPPVPVRQDAFNFDDEMERLSIDEEEEEPEEPQEEPETHLRRTNRAKRSAPVRFTYDTFIKRTRSGPAKTVAPTTKNTDGAIDWNKIGQDYIDSFQRKDEVTYETSNNFVVKVSKRRGGKSAGSYDSYLIVPDTLRAKHPGLIRGTRLRSVKEFERFRAAVNLRQH